MKGFCSAVLLLGLLFPLAGHAQLSGFNTKGDYSLQLDSKTSTGITDLYIQPIVLGWSKKRADFTAGLGIYAPTGEFEVGGEEVIYTSEPMATFWQKFTAGFVRIIPVRSQL